MSLRALMRCVALLSTLMTSCAFTTEVSPKLEPRIAEEWFSAAEFKQGRVAVMPHVFGEGVAFDRSDFDEHVIMSLRAALNRDGVTPIRPPRTRSIEDALRSAREIGSDWLVVVRVLDVQQVRFEEEERETGDDGEVITETCYWSSTTVSAGMEIYRVGDGVRGCVLRGTRTRRDAESEFDEDGGFLDALISGLFVDADHPPFPEPEIVAKRLVEKLIVALLRSD